MINLQGFWLVIVNEGTERGDPEHLDLPMLGMKAKEEDITASSPLTPRNDRSDQPDSGLLPTHSRHSSSFTGNTAISNK